MNFLRSVNHRAISLGAILALSLTFNLAHAIPVTVDTARIEKMTANLLALSDCTAINPALSNLAPGTAKALVATCNNSPAATGYVWKIQKAGAVTPTALACTGASCTVPAANLATVGTYTVTVTNNNAGGVGVVAGRATVSVLTQPLSACTAITPAAPAVTLGAASPLLTATCNNSPTSYAWKVGTTTLTSCTGSTCTVPAASLPAAGSYSVTVKANKIK